MIMSACVARSTGRTKTLRSLRKRKGCGLIKQVRASYIACVRTWGEGSLFVVVLDGDFLGPVPETDLQVDNKGLAEYKPL